MPTANGATGGALLLVAACSRPAAGCALDPSCSSRRRRGSLGTYLRDRGCIATVVAETGSADAGEWVLLLYRLPRQPSTPRSAVWRRLKRLGVAQMADGVVALPADARTREQLEWVADEVRAAAGTAVVWLARPTSVRQEQELASALSAARAQEYLAVREQAQALGDAASPQERVRTARRLREELRRIRRRDFFPPAERDAAVAAVQALATRPWQTEDQPGHGENSDGGHAPEDLRCLGRELTAAAGEPAGSEVGR